MKKGEIWFADTSGGKGHEQEGTRPFLVLAEACGLVIGLPLTKSFDTLLLSPTYPLNKTKENGLKEDSIVLIFQITALDKNVRFKFKIGEIAKEHMEAIDELLKDLLKI